MTEEKTKSDLKPDSKRKKRPRIIYKKIDGTTYEKVGKKIIPKSL